MMKKKSIFDDIFHLQSSAPDFDVDPEDLQNGLQAKLVEATEEETQEVVGPSRLRQKAAVITDDPKYKGRRTSRKDLYSEDEEEDNSDNDDSSDFPDNEPESKSDLDSNESTQDDQVSSEEEEEGESHEGGSQSDSDEMGEESEIEEEEEEKDKEDATIMDTDNTDDREKGKAVQGQLEVWDQIIKTHISVHKLLTLCNQLPPPAAWGMFNGGSDTFAKEAAYAHRCIKKVLSKLLEIQALNENKADEDDEEITSDEEEGEGGGGEGEREGKPLSLDALDDKEESDEEEKEDDDDREEEQTSKKQNTPSVKLHKNSKKRKLDSDGMEAILSKRHADFKQYRNSTLSKWDEKTRLIHNKVNSKNFAAFEMSVLKQIDQVLANKGRLLARLHTKRGNYRILGTSSSPTEEENREEAPDDDEDVQPYMKRSKQEVAINPEIVDDSDFYQVCLQDFIQGRQNDETDPVLANRQWLEIQRQRNKQKKRKVDTRASKGRKIRYNIREKLVNLMTPFDKSTWSDEQKDDLFKALFGGGHTEKEEPSEVEAPTINIGL